MSRAGWRAMLWSLRLHQIQKDREREDMGAFGVRDIEAFSYSSRPPILPTCASAPTPEANSVPRSEKATNRFRCCRSVPPDERSLA